MKVFRLSLTEAGLSSLLIFKFDNGIAAQGKSHTLSRYFYANRLADMARFYDQGIQAPFQWGGSAALRADLLAALSGCRFKTPLHKVFFDLKHPACIHVQPPSHRTGTIGYKLISSSKPVQTAGLRSKPTDSPMGAALFLADMICAPLIAPNPDQPFVIAPEVPKTGKQFHLSC